MPSKSKNQFKYIWAMRRKYKSKKNAACQCPKTPNTYFKGKCDKV